MTSDIGVELPLVEHWIGGERSGGTGEQRGEVYDPSTGKVTKKVVFASGADVDKAVAAASSAFSASAPG